MSAEESTTVRLGTRGPGGVAEVVVTVSASGWQAALAACEGARAALGTLTEEWPADDDEGIEDNAPFSEPPSDTMLACPLSDCPVLADSAAKMQAHVESAHR